MATTTWQIDPAHSTIEFSVKHMMITTVRGRFTRFTGMIHADEQNPNSSTAVLDIDVASIDTGVPDRDAHLKAPDFFDVQNFPTIAFKSTRISGAHGKAGDRFEMIGELTIRGQQTPVTIPVTFEGVAKDPWGKQRAGFSAATEIDRRHWGLEWNAPLETGGVLIGHAVKITVDIQAVKQETGQAVA